MRTTRMWRVMGLLGAAVVMGHAVACEAPIAFMSQQTHQLTSQLAALPTHRALNQAQGKVLTDKEYKGFVRQRQMKIIHTVVLPMVDVGAISRSVVGGPVWGKASVEQRQAFMKAFTDLVLGFYLAAFSGDIQDYKIEYKPIRGKPDPSKVVAVSVIDSAQGMSPVQVKYYLTCRSGSWQITDYDINAISMVANYRSQFASILTSQGFVALTKAIELHNERMRD